MKTSILAAIALSAASYSTVCTGQEIDDKAMLEHSVLDSRPVLDRPDTVTMVFLGDIMLHADQIRSAAAQFGRSTSAADKAQSAADQMQSSDADSRYDFSPFLEDIAEDISDADLAVANMEFTLAGPPYTGYPAFSAPDRYAGYMAECGIDIFLTANNHILDKGRDGIVRTMTTYRKLEEEYGIRTTGTSICEEQYRRDNPLIIETGGLRMALVNFTYGTNMSVSGEYPKVNRSGKAQLSSLMDKASESGADLIIALPHWGEEYSLHHSGAQKELAEWLAERGADIIIGAHPHVVQDSMHIHVNSQDGTRTVPVVYSLGNTISNMSAPCTQIGLMATLRAVKLMNGKVKIFPMDFTYLWCSLPGRLKETHSTIPVKEYLGKRYLWEMPYEYDKMVRTYYDVKEKTGIPD